MGPVDQRAQVNPFAPGYYETDELRGFGFRRVGEGVRVAKNTTIVGLENVTLDDHCRIDGHCTIVATGGTLRLGRYVHVHTSVVIGCRGGVVLDDYSGVSHGCNILSASDDFSGQWMHNGTVPAHLCRPTIEPVWIGRHVAVGAGCTFLPGVTLGDGAAVGAHSLVQTDVPPWVIVAGTPARQVGVRSRRLLALVPREDAAA